MEAQQSTQTYNDQFSELGERMARMESKMDHVATHRDLAAVRSEIAMTDARIADLRVEVLKEIGGVKTDVADVKTLVANREVSMQRWLLGITATTVVGVSTAMAGVVATLFGSFG